MEVFWKLRFRVHESRPRLVFLKEIAAAACDPRRQRRGRGVEVLKASRASTRPGLSASTPGGRYPRSSPWTRTRRARTTPRSWASSPNYPYCYDKVEFSTPTLVLIGDKDGGPRPNSARDVKGKPDLERVKKPWRDPRLQRCTFREADWTTSDITSSMTKRRCRRRKRTRRRLNGCAHEVGRGSSDFSANNRSAAGGNRVGDARARGLQRSGEANNAADEMTALARTRVLPEATPLGPLSARCRPLGSASTPGERRNPAVQGSMDHSRLRRVGSLRSGAPSHRAKELPSPPGNPA